MGSGSSPLTRGKHCAVQVVRESQLAHPRSRGENRRGITGRAGRAGSSPLTRGKRLRCRLQQERDRLIPAHAGKTWWRPPPSTRCAAHPRSRGENSVKSVVAKPINGSSPLTRGKPVDLHECEANLRLIPAHAGKTGLPRQSPPRGAAHPRSRGENPTFAAIVSKAAGSSPLTRGKPAIRPRRVRGRRLIPAHAGKTSAGCRKR